MPNMTIGRAANRYRFVGLYIAIVLITVYVNYWPFITGDRSFFHDSIWPMTTFGLFYDRLFSGDSWLWSSSLNAGHPLWLAIETTPFWDPIAVLCYGIAGAFQLTWQTPYQITVFLWLLVFALGGSACAHALTGNRWAGVLAFVLLFGGPTAHMIPAQSAAAAEGRALMR